MTHTHTQDESNRSRVGDLEAELSRLSGEARLAQQRALLHWEQV